jgi:hypothetical protein
MKFIQLFIYYLCVLLLPGLAFASDFDIEQGNLVKLASKTTTPAATLRQLAHTNSVKVRVAVASNRRAPDDLYLELSADRSARVRMALALNIDAPERAKLNMARDENHNVRLRLAKCGYMYPSVLKILATDDAADVRELVAANDNATEEILAILRKDPDEHVRMTAIKHARLAGTGVILN